MRRPSDKKVKAMTNYFKSFATSEAGAVTVDWVVLTAALVGLGLAVMAVVSPGIENLSGDIDNALTNQTIADTFTAGSGLVQSSVE